MTTRMTTRKAAAGPEREDAAELAAPAEDTAQPDADERERQALAEELRIAQEAEAAARSGTEAVLERIAERDSRERRLAFEAFAADVAAGRDPAAVLAAAAEAEAALTRLIGLIDARKDQITRLVGRLRGGLLAVPQTQVNVPRRAADFGWGWRPDAKQPILLTPERTLKPLGGLVDAVVARACVTAGHKPLHLMTGPPAPANEAVRDLASYVTELW